MKRLLVVIAALPVFWASSAPASVILSLDSVVHESGTIYDWIYRAVLQPDQTLRTNDFVTLYDVGSFITANFGATNPALDSSFNLTQQPFGFNPSSGGPTESALPNFTVHYTGTNLVPSATGGEVTLGNLVIRANTNQRLDSVFAAQTANTLSGLPVSNGGAVSVPIPEPGSVALLIAGLAAIGGLSIRRRTLD